MPKLKMNDRGEYYTVYGGTPDTVHFTNEIIPWARKKHINVGDELPPSWHSETLNFQYTHGQRSSRLGCKIVKSRCPVCGEGVFYYENESGSKVYFDSLGWPWPKHPCIAYQSNTNLKPLIERKYRGSGVKRYYIVSIVSSHGKTILCLSDGKDDIYVQIEKKYNPIITLSDVYLCHKECEIAFVYNDIVICEFSYTDYVSYLNFKLYSDVDNVKNNTMQIKTKNIKNKWKKYKSKLKKIKSKFELPRQCELMIISESLYRKSYSYAESNIPSRKEKFYIKVHFASLIENDNKQQNRCNRYRRYYYDRLKSCVYVYDEKRYMTCLYVDRIGYGEFLRVKNKIYKIKKKNQK